MSLSSEIPLWIESYWNGEISSSQSFEFNFLSFIIFSIGDGTSIGTESIQKLTLKKQRNGHSKSLMLAQQKWSSGSLIVLGGLLKLIIRGWLGKLQHGPFKSRSSTVQCQRQLWWHWRVYISYFRCGENGQILVVPQNPWEKYKKIIFWCFQPLGVQISSSICTKYHCSGTRK